MSIVNALRTSVAGMGAQSNALGAIGSNIANSATVGYKSANAQFEAMLAQTASPTLSSGGVLTDTRYAVSSQGVLTATNSSTDLAINGKGFFAVNGQGGGTHLTRAGSFTPDASGNLVNSAGYALMGYANGSSTLTPVNVAGAGAVSFASDGTLTQVSTKGIPSTVYKVPIATVTSPDNLTQVNGDIFDQSATSGNVNFSAPSENGAGSLSSGFLEQSTVDLGNELTNMIVTQRSYEANSKALQTSSDLFGSLKNLGSG